MSKSNAETDFALEMQGYFSDANRTNDELFSWLYSIAKVINNNHHEIDFDTWRVILEIIAVFQPQHSIK